MAAVKITRHNLLRPTALIHEAGHQVAHIAGWNQELAAALSQALADTSSERAGIGPGGRRRSRRTRWPSSTPVLPVWRRCTMCSPAKQRPCSVTRRRSASDLLPARAARRGDLPLLLRRGPWDDLGLVDAASFAAIGAARSAALLDASMPVLKTIVRITFDTPMQAFRGAPLRAIVIPERVSPGR